MHIPENIQPELQLRTAELIAAGQSLYALGMVPATSGNFSARLSSGHLAITVSGCHKGRLQEENIMLVDAQGGTLDGRRSSAETGLHVQIYRRFPEARAILHPHSVNATLLSRLNQGHLVLQDYEILKAFPGINTHDCSVVVPIFDNDQDIVRLAENVDQYVEAEGNIHGYLIKGHGFYTWGNSVEDALRHVEAFEFLFDCELRMRGATKS
ncbi:MAG: methylthioribulose 1-phosphate dehydratase [Gammaproteobacteria bacterium]|nr:methylthioribulose 1-phosphate dehydratase [Gammaproteobacteria bacterium]MDH5651708.1 methylthioribulose 1-phosphate dehydratase [Gammaproteobacteria bacterium]